MRRVEKRRTDFDNFDIVEYDRDGRRVAYESHQPDQPVGYSKTLYDASGRLLGYEYSSAESAEPTGTTRYVYDDGDLIRIEYEGLNGPTRPTTEVRRRPGGGRIEIVPADKRFNSTSVVASTTTEYDEDDRKVVETTYDDDQALLSTTRYIYDDSGLLVEEQQEADFGNGLAEAFVAQVPAAGLLPDAAYAALINLFVGAYESHVTYLYDDRDRRIERRLTGPMTGEADELQQWEYNDHDDVVRMVRVQPSVGYRIGLGGATKNESPPTISVYTFEYEYDDRGNWTRQSHTARAPEGEPWYEAVVSRVIEYYE